jgi:CPA1 family monovalent cation:H+ antiporter
MHDVVLSVLAVTTLLGLVSLLLPLAARLRIPYAVLLAVVGCGLGAAVGVAGHAGGPVAELLRVLGGLNLSGEAFLYIFLPALLFETAINVDVRRLFDEIAPVLLLAIVAVVVSTFVVGFALWPVAGVGLAACLLLGATLATTDPVAVVAIFRDIGAPRRLSMLLEGESLFNDAAAIALFTLLAATITGAGAASPIEGVLAFLRAFAGGLAFGTVAGLAACAVLPIFREHPLGEVTLTIALAYLAFVLGEHYLHISGVVAAVSAGLVLSYEGRRRLSPSSWERLAATWEQLGFWASSLIFLLAAMLAPRMLAAAGWYDLLLLAILILAAFAARAATLFGLLPLLSAAGLAERVRTSYKLVILWGGMRGAISLALALAVTENEALPTEVRRFVAILATGFVLFTLLVNAPTLRIVMRLLGLDRLSPAELALRERALALSRAEIADGIDRMARRRGLRGELAGEIAAGYRGSAAPPGTGNADYRLDPEARAYSGLTILAEREQELCSHHFEDRTASRRAVAGLLAQASRLRDGIKSGGLAGYLDAAAAGLGFRWSFRLALLAQRRLGIAGPLSRRLSDRLERLLTGRLVLQDLAEFNETKVRPLFGEETAGLLRGALATRLGETERAVAAIELQYPSYAEALVRQFLALSALRLEDEGQHRLREESILSQELFNGLQRELNQRRHALERRPRLDLGLKREELVERVAMFADLDPELRSRITRLLRPRLVVPGEAIVRRGERGDAMYFVSSGAVEVRVDPVPVQLGSGQFFGELALLDDRPRTADVVSLGFCQLLSLSRRDFEGLLAADDGLRQRIDAVAEERRARA